MEEMNKMDLWDCVDNALMDMQIYLDVFDLLKYNLEELIMKKDGLSGYALQQLNNLFSLCCVIGDGFKGVQDTLKNGMSYSDE